MSANVDSNNNNNQLLGQLKIDRSQREAVHAPRTLWITLLALLAVALLGALGYFLLSRPRGIPVKTAIAEAPAGASSAVLQASGYVTAERKTTVSAEIAGMLTHVYFQEGQSVRRGQVLAKLDDSATLATLQQAQAQTLAAVAQLRQYQVQWAEARRDLARDEALIHSVRGACTVSR